MGRLLGGDDGLAAGEDGGQLVVGHRPQLRHRRQGGGVEGGGRARGAASEGGNDGQQQLEEGGGHSVRVLELEGGEGTD